MKIIGFLKANLLQFYNFCVNDARSIWWKEKNRTHYQYNVLIHSQLGVKVSHERIKSFVDVSFGQLENFSIYIRHVFFTVWNLKVKYLIFFLYFFSKKKWTNLPGLSITVIWHGRSTNHYLRTSSFQQRNLIFLAEVSESYHFFGHFYQSFDSNRSDVDYFQQLRR